MEARLDRGTYAAPLSGSGGEIMNDEEETTVTDDGALTPEGYLAQAPLEELRRYVCLDLARLIGDLSQRLGYIGKWRGHQGLCGGNFKQSLRCARHVEILEFLFEVLGRQLRFDGPAV